MTLNDSDIRALGLTRAAEKRLRQVVNTLHALGAEIELDTRPDARRRREELGRVLDFLRQSVARLVAIRNRMVLR